MKKTLTLLLIIFMSIPLLHGQEWNFETDFNAEGWVGVGEGTEGTQLNVENGVLTATTIFWEGPRIQNPDLGGISAANTPKLTIRLATDADAYWINPETGVQWPRNIRVFWKRDNGEGYSADRLINQQYLPLEDPNEFQKIEIDLSQHADWSGNVDAIRLDLGYNNGKQVDVDYIFLMDTTATTSAGLIHVKESFAIYPNPAKEFVYVTGNWNEPVAYEIFSINGMHVSKGLIHSDKHRIELPKLLSGFYLINIENQISKLIIQ